MASLNKVMIIGRLGRDPETRSTQGGNKIANLRVAVSETWKDKQTGERRENTEWVSVVAFDALAGICEQYLRKGSMVYVEGQLKTRKWQDQSGADRYTTEVRATEMKMLSPKSENGGGGNSGGYGDSGGGYRGTQIGENPGGGYGSQRQGGYSAPSYDEDSIPF